MISLWIFWAHTLSLELFLDGREGILFSGWTHWQPHLTFMERGPRQKGVWGSGQHASKVSLEMPPDSQLGWTWTGVFPEVAFWLVSYSHLKLGRILHPWTQGVWPGLARDSMLFSRAERVAGAAVSRPGEGRLSSFTSLRTKKLECGGC